MILMQLPLLKFFILFSFQWFNLNSLLTGPELISDTYLALFLAQLQQEGIGKKTTFIHLFRCCTAEKITAIYLCRVFHICDPRKPSRVRSRADSWNHEGPAAAAAQTDWRRGGPD